MQRTVATRFGTGERPDVPMQWPSDHGSIYTALDTHCTAERLPLVPMTPPAARPIDVRPDAKPNGRRRSMKKDPQTLKEARGGDEVAIAVPGPTIGRQVHEGDILYMDIPESDAKWLLPKGTISPEEKDVLVECRTARRKVATQGSTGTPHRSLRRRFTSGTAPLSAAGSRGAARRQF